MELIPKDLENRRKVARVVKLSAPGFGWCLRCEMPWKFIEHHSTPYTYNRACFALCEMCWNDLTIEERLPYYEQLLKMWHVQSPVEGGQAEAIIGAVVRGL